MGSLLGWAGPWDGVAPGKDESSCDGVTRDSTKAAVTWGDTKTLAELKGRYVRLVFHIKNAKLYSFWIE